MKPSKSISHGNWRMPFFTWWMSESVPRVKLVLGLWYWKMRVPDIQQHEKKNRQELGQTWETAAKSLGKRTENVNEKNTFVETNHFGGRLILFSFQIRLPLLLNVYQNWTLFYSENNTCSKKSPTDSFWENTRTIFSRFSSDMSGDYARVSTWPHGCWSWK